MNELIEQLGGYEASKNILLRKRYDHVSYSVDSDSFYDHEAAEHGAIDIQELDDALLEYRRENDIYEAGDWVHMGENSGLQQVEATYLHFVDIGMGPMNACNFKHATDAEIEAGCRL